MAEPVDETNDYEDHYKEILRQHRDYLTEGLDLDSSILLDLLKANDVITDFQYQTIKTKSSEADKVDFLVRTLIKRDKVHYKRFCQLLEETEQGHIRRELNKQGKEQSKKKSVNPALQNNRRVCSALLSEDRVNLLKQNKDALVSQIRCCAIIKDFAKQHLDLEISDEGSVDDMINKLQTNLLYDEFCKSLYLSKQEAIVKTYLTSKYDIVSGQHNLAEYYLHDFSVLSLFCRHEGSERVALKDLFVPLSWSRYKDRQLQEQEHIDGYSVMFKKIQDDLQNSRVVIEGEAGRGKTTFIKRLCFLWALGFTNQELPEDTCHDLLNYSLVLPIILRLVDRNSTLVDVLHDQLGHKLSTPEVLAIEKLLHKYPNCFLIALDGYDELSASNTINSILSKEHFAKILCFTTTRPYSVKQIQNLTAQQNDLILKLLGFNKGQILKYFISFLELYGKSEEEAQRLFHYLEKKRQDLLKLAKAPICCEMICIVWNAYGKLGDTIGELYWNFIDQLFQHFEKKEIKDRQIEQVNREEILLKLARLANTWTKGKKLNIVFTTKQILEELGKDEFKLVLQLGLLTKTHPSSHLDNALYQFPHLSIQEFLVAYRLGHAEDCEIEKFASQCNRMKVLEKSEIILKFLVSEYPAQANKILETIIKTLEKVKDEQTKYLTHFLIKLCPHFHEAIKIPLPSFVNFADCSDGLYESEIFHEDIPDPDWNDVKIVGIREYGQSQVTENLTKLINMGKDKNFQTMKKANIKLPQYSLLLQLDYIDELCVEISQNDNMHDIRLQSNLHTRNTTLNKLSISALNHTISDIWPLLQCVSYDHLKSLSISCKELTGMVPDILYRYTGLQKLYIHETTTSTTPQEPARMSNFVQDESKKSQLKSMDIYDSNSSLSQMCPIFKSISPDHLLSLNVECAKVTTCLFDITLQFIQLQELIVQKSWSANDTELSNTEKGRDLDSAGQETRTENKISREVNIEKELTYAGNLLGEMLNYMTHLRVLRLEGAGINKDTIKHMLEVMSEREYPLIELYLSRNDLSGSGQDLGKVVSLMPELHTLSLDECNFDPVELAAMAEVVPDSNKIQVLSLYSNMDYKEYEARGWYLCLSALKKMPHLQAVNLSRSASEDPRYDPGFYLTVLWMRADPTYAICEAVSAGALANLQVLDMSSSRLLPGSLQMLGEHLPKMTQLKAIDLSEIERVVICEYEFVYKNLSPSVKHLNIYMYNHDHEVTSLLTEMIMKNKQQLRHLQRLNVPIISIEMIQEHLEELNPDIQVYSMPYESVWDMYV